MAIFIIGMVVDGYWMNHIVPRGPARLDQRHWHALFGVYFGLLVVLRILWRLANPTPEEVPGQSRWQSLLARLVHAVIYALIVVIPTAGWVTWSARPAEQHNAISLFGIVPLPWVVSAPDRALEHLSEDWHIYLAYTLIVLAGLHAVAALWHHFIKRDRVLVRMLPFPA